MPKKTTNKDLPSIVKLIRSNANFLITSHINPDGDSISSQLSLSSLLSILGKKATIVSSHPVPRIYRFLSGADDILVRRRHSPRPYDAIFVLDCGHSQRIGVFPKGKVEIPVVNIDHHYTNQSFGSLNWIDPVASSTCEMIYRLARKLNVKPTREMAEALYTGITTDTGSFRYSSTSPESLMIASKLMLCGVNVRTISENVFENNQFSSLRLLGEALTRLDRSADGRVTWITIPHKEISRLSSLSETEDFVNYPRSVDGAVISICFKEPVPGEVRVSFRSKGNVNVADLAARYNGGGHRNAAGCLVRRPLKSAIKEITTAARRYLDEEPS